PNTRLARAKASDAAESSAVAVPTLSAREVSAGTVCTVTGTVSVTGSTEVDAVGTGAVSAGTTGVEATGTTGVEATGATVSTGEAVCGASDEVCPVAARRAARREPGRGGTWAESSAGAGAASDTEG